jgi:polyisoprenoid-binding protein YceI
MPLAALLLLVILAVADATAMRQIDPAGSKVVFSVPHVFVERVTGTVPIVSGNVVLPQNSLVPTNVTAVLDPTKMKTGENDRDGVLQTSDWFDTAKYPTWTFASTKVSPGANGSAFAIDGILTIHGISRLEHLTVTVAGTPTHPMYRAVGQIDRHAFGMNVTRLDPAIGNPVDVTLDIVLK